MSRNIKNPKILAVIQSRMGSSRLPGKAGVELAGKSLTWHVIDRAKRIDGIDLVILATSTEKIDEALLELAKKSGAEAFAGPLDDVLERFVLAGRKFGGDYIMRITGDNPFTDPHYASLTLETALSESADLCSLSGLPLGTAVEVVSMRALETAHVESRLPHQREHVTPYIKEHPEKFKIVKNDSGFRCPIENLRLTVDTAEDYALARAVYDGLYRGAPFRLEDAVGFLEKHRELVSINSEIKQRPMTHSSGND